MDQQKTPKPQAGSDDPAANASPEAANQQQATDGGLRGAGGSPGFGSNAEASDPQAQAPQRPGGGGSPGTGT